MIRYVCGFARVKNEDRILLIKKERPQWQRHLMNGVGGKIEVDETIYQAMVREFREETSIITKVNNWCERVRLKNDNYFVHFFFTTLPLDVLNSAKQTTDEVPMLVDICDLHITNVIPNLRWLIPLCFDYEVLGIVEIDYGDV